MTLQELNTILQPYWISEDKREYRFDSGWAQLVHDLHQEIIKIDPNYQIICIKEKFGGLRYYYGSLLKTWVPEIDELIGKAYTQSITTCEICGKQGTLSIYGEKFKIIKTMCSECREDNNGTLFCFPAPETFFNSHKAE